MGVGKIIFAPIQYVIDSILNHNREATAHSDIRTAITEGDKGLSDQLNVLSEKIDKFIGIEISSYGITDLNNFKDFGIELFSLNDTLGRNIANLPIPITYGYNVKNIRTNNSQPYFVQEFTMRKTANSDNPAKYTRKCENGVWSEWISYATSDKIDTLWDGNMTTGTTNLVKAASGYNCIIINYGASTFSAYTLDRNPHKVIDGSYSIAVPDGKIVFTLTGTTMNITAATVPVRRIVGVLRGGI